MKITPSSINSGKNNARKPNHPSKSGAITASEPLNNPYKNERVRDQKPVHDIVEIAGIPASELTPRVHQVLSGLLEEVDKLRTEIAQLRVNVKEAKALADTDPLLGIPNRRAFARELGRSLAMVKRYNHSATLVFIDLNHLKKINDTYGHMAGDAALEHVTEIFKSNIRAVDSFARLGGDEFGLILDKADKNIARQKIADLNQRIFETPLIWQGTPLPLTVANGIVEISGNRNIQEILELADQLMYKNKTLARANR